MSKILGETLPEEIIKLFNQESTTTVLSTITPDGYPHAMPLHVLCAPDENTVLMSLMKNHQSTENIKDNGKAMLTVLDGEDIAAGIKGSAQVVKEPMEANNAMVIVEFKVDQVKSDTAPTVIVTQGVQFKHRSEKTEAFFRGCFDELYQYGNMK